MSQPSWIGRTLNDRYVIDELLGQGGMSAVYRATDPNLKRIVAIKLIHPHLSEKSEFVSRFEEEAAAVAKLRHDNIVQVYDFDHDQNVYFIVFEYVAGETLQENLERLNAQDKTLPIDQAIKIAIDMAKALGYAHKKGLIHRDMKPANIMLSLQGNAILTDFGISKIVGGSQHTATGAVLGTARYMSPEQIRGEVIDNRTDLYALGVTLFEMVASQPPYNANSVMTLMMMHINDPVPALGAIRSDVPADLIAVINKAMAKDRNQRFQSAEDLVRALQQVRTSTDATEVRAPAAAAFDATLIDTNFSVDAPTPAPVDMDSTLVEPVAAPVFTSQPTQPPLQSGSSSSYKNQPPLQTSGATSQARTTPAAPAATAPPVEKKKSPVLMIVGGLLGLLLICGIVGGLMLRNAVKGFADDPTVVALFDNLTPTTESADPDPTATEEAIAEVENTPVPEADATDTPVPDAPEATPVPVVANSGDMVPYYATDFGYSFLYPQSWYTEEDTDVVLLANSPELVDADTLDSGAIAVLVAEQVGDVDPAEAVSIAIESFGLENTKILSGPDPIEVGPHDAAMSKVSALFEGSDVIGTIAAVSNGDYTTIFMGFTPPAEDKAWSPVFMDMIQSIRVGTPGDVPEPGTDDGGTVAVPSGGELTGYGSEVITYYEVEPGDEQFFPFIALEGETVRMVVSPDGDYDAVIRVEDTDDVVLLEVDETTGDEVAEFVAPKDALYFFIVNGFGEQSGAYTVYMYGSTNAIIDVAIGDEINAGFGEKDYIEYGFFADAGTAFSLEVTPNEATDLVIQILDADDNVLAESDENPESGAESISFTLVEEETVYIRITEFYENPATFSMFVNSGE